MVPVEEYDKGSEEPVENYWDENDPVYGALDESQSEWPSMNCLSDHSTITRKGRTHLRGLCLDARAYNVVVRWCLPNCSTAP